MTEATAKPAEYTEFSQPEDGFHSFNVGHPIPSQYLEATRAGWKVTVPQEHGEDAEQKADVQDSLEALKEEKGVDLGDFRRELGV